MSTRSLIGIENENKTVNAVYCHSDGYPSYVGLFLYAFWNSEGQARTITGLGFLSSIGARVGYTVDFNKYFSDTHYYDRFKYQCIAYCRDRGEKFEVIQVKSKEELYKASFNAEYIYIFRNGEWWVKSNNTKLRKLANVLAEDKEVLDPNRQKSFLNSTSLLEDEKQRLFDALVNLGALRITKKDTKISQADFIIEQQFDSNNFSVRCTANNRYSCMSRREIQALKDDGCVVEVKKGVFVKI